MKKVLTFGVYDLLHVGHVKLFQNARALGDELIVAVQDEKSILKYKPETKVVYSTEDRLYMVESLKFVDRAVIYNDVHIDIKLIDFDIFVKGPDQCHSGFQAAEEWCRQNGKQVVVIQRTEGISSTMLRGNKESE